LPLPPRNFSEFRTFSELTEITRGNGRFTRELVGVIGPVAHPTRLVETKSARLWATRFGKLMPQFQLLGNRLVTGQVGVMQIVQQPPALADHDQQTPAGGVILLVALQVFSQMVDALGEQRDLHVCRTRVFLVQLECFDRLFFSFHTCLVQKMLAKTSYSHSRCKAFLISQQGGLNRSAPIILAGIALDTLPCLNESQPDMSEVKYLSLNELEAGLDTIRQAPKDLGVLKLISRRPNTDEREVLTEGQLDPAHGLVGDNWKARGSRSTPDGSANPEMQLNVMNARVIELLAQDKERWALAGDQLFVDFDLSETNVPTGTRLVIGAAVIEITAPPHLGCKKFSVRFGPDAMKFVNSPEGKQLHLRGVNAKVVQPAVIRTGDSVKKL
jgi:hypothetical protein